MKIIQVQDLFQRDVAHARLPHRKAFAKGSAYVNHKICPVDKASVPITDLGFTRADAVYDVVTISKGQFFKLEEHQKRFANSLAKIEIEHTLRV
jgi:Branched-chain amino acid aminotransferase/4-amino-4-deoxychorismate lyase